MRQETTTIYTFNELTPDMQQEVLDSCRDFNTDYGWHEFIYDDAQAVFEILGFDFQDKQRFYFSGFCSQGDGACIALAKYSYNKGMVKQIKEYAPQDTELHEIAQRLQRLQAGAFYTITADIRHSGRYHHERAMSIDSECERGSFAESDFKDIVSDLCLWLYKQLETEYDWLTSDESIKETIILNEYEFTAEGILCC